MKFRKNPNNLTDNKYCATTQSDVRYFEVNLVNALCFKPHSAQLMSDEKDKKTSNYAGLSCHLFKACVSDGNVVIHRILLADTFSIKAE